MIFHRTFSHQTHAQQTCSIAQVDTLKIFSVTNFMSIIFGYIVFAMCIAFCCPQAPLNSEWPYRVVDGAKELSSCEGLGFPNATKNECGYCTEGTTGLPRNFGKDCRGVCGNRAVVDCAEECGGKAYIDECSGECVGGSTNKGESNIANTNRDCRGFCLAYGGQYFIDSCRVCHTGVSPFQDCTNKCHLPGQEHMMAKILCGRCVGGSSGVPDSEVLDQCGNCRSGDTECICNGTGHPDPCGVCNGGGKTCMQVINFFPQALPNGTEADIFIKGAFRGRLRNMKCLLTIVLAGDEMGRQLEFIGSSNGTHVKCRIKLVSAMYRVGVSLEVGENPEVSNVEDTELLVYNNAEYGEMIPSKAVFDRDISRKLTVTFTGGKVPPRPLICIVTGKDWPSKFRLTQSESNSLDTCVIPFVNSSMKVNVAPSLNGIHPFKKKFDLTFYASPPGMLEYYIAEDGHAVVIVFDRPINLCKLENCHDLLNNETLIRLSKGGNATCKWATKLQLVITVQRPILDNPIRITFKRGILKQDDQQYAMPKNEGLTIDVWSPRPSSDAQIAISGPTTVPTCGDFTLVGHFSSPKGDANYFWTATRADQQKLGEQITEYLIGSKSASLTLDAAVLEIGMNYTFVLTAEQPLNKKYAASHVVLRKPYMGPLVTAFSDVMTQPSVTIDQKITLQAEVSLPECIREMETIHLMWSVNNPRVKFDFLSRNSQIYKILPYSLPENTVVIFTANAFFGNLLNVTSSKLTLRVEPFILKASIKGSSKRIIGNKDGVLVLESGISKGDVPLVYQWRCYETANRDVCYNYKRNATNALLITRDLQTKAKIEIPCDSFKAGQILTFELQVFNAKKQYQASTTASTIVIVQNGSMPQVVIQSVIADGIAPFEKHPTTGAYNIPAQLAITIHATLKTAKTKLRSIKWDIKGFSTPFTYSTMNENTYLALEDGFLVDHGIYLIGLSACDYKGSCGIANLTITAVAGISLCQLIMPPYVEYEPIEANVTGCSIPPGRQPLVYQLYLHLNGSVFPLTPPQTATTFKFFGPPVSMNNITQMSVQVCDKFNLCQLFAGNPVKVYASQDKNEDRLKLLDKAEKALNANNAMASLSMFLTASCDSKIGITDDETEEMLAAAQKAVVNRYVNSGQLALIYSAMLPLLKKPDKNTKLKALAVMRRATRQAFGYQVKPPASVLTLGHGNSIEAIQSSNSDVDVLQRVHQTLNTIVECIARTLPLGKRLLLEGKKPGEPTTLVFRQLLDKSPIRIEARSQNGKVEGIVGFEPEIRESVRRWKCRKTNVCNGAVVSLTLYPERAPFPPKTPRVSPVLDINLRKPDTGLAVTFSEMANAVRMVVSQKGNATAAKEKGTSFKCMFWDESEREWSKEGVLTMGSEGNTKTCWASHLSTFGVFEIYEGLAISSIVGIVVAVLMGVFIFGMLSFFFIRQKQTKRTRVSNEALQPKHQEKHQGIERSVARVRRTP